MEPPVLDMAAVVEDSSTRTPLIFVLSPGVVSLFAKANIVSLHVSLCVLFISLSRFGIILGKKSDIKPLSGIY